MALQFDTDDFDTEAMRGNEMEVVADKSLAKPMNTANNGAQRFRSAERLCAFSLIFGVLLMGGSYAAYRAWGQSSAEASADDAFEAFALKYGKVYESAEERQMRLAIFRANYALIQSENAKGLPFTLAVNDFADQTAPEFRLSHMGLTVTRPSKLWGDLPHLGTEVEPPAAPANGSDVPAGLPASVDWSTKGSVTTPKNQAQCGACWAFSSTGALEGAWSIAAGKLVSLSEQQLVDCDHGSNGCGGGAMDPAFDYARNAPICTEDSYPYVAKSTTCRQTNCTAGIPKGGVVGFKDVQVNSEAALMAAVARQPVSVGIEADQTGFQFYSGGILTKECGASLDHGVLLVGYGTDAGVPYWKLKNSWSSQWGEGGFIRIQRGKGGAGQCGVAAMASYPVVDAAMAKQQTSAPAAEASMKAIVV